LAWTVRRALSNSSTACGFLPLLWGVLHMFLSPVTTSITTSIELVRLVAPTRVLEIDSSFRYPMGDIFSSSIELSWRNDPRYAHSSPDFWYEGLRRMPPTLGWGVSPTFG
jgi:hypothetical protein